MSDEGGMMSEGGDVSEEEAAEEEGGGAEPRRDPSEKQEPHIVMWGKIVYRILKQIALSISKSVNFPFKI